MAMIETIEEPVPEPRLFITIGNDEPIDAEELGRLVRELGADYKRSTGGTLVLARLELGSTLMEVVDTVILVGGVVGAGVAFAEAGERIVKFWGFMKSYLKGSADTKSDLELLPVASSGSRLLDIADKHRANLKISRDLLNQKETIELTFPEVSKANKRAKADKKNKRTKRLQRPEEQLQIDSLARRLSDQAPAGSGFDQMESVVETIIEIVKVGGGGYMLSAIANALEGINRWDLAQVVRRHIDEGKNRQPVTRD